MERVLQALKADAAPKSFDRSWTPEQVGSCQGARDAQFVMTIAAETLEVQRRVVDTLALLASKAGGRRWTWRA